MSPDLGFGIDFGLGSLIYSLPRQDVLEGILGYYIIELDELLSKVS